MSSFMIWHKIVIDTVTPSTAGGLGAKVASVFGLGLPLTISNNVYSLGLILDADVKLTMSEGATADQFTITVYDLPDKDFTLLSSAHASGTLAATISLGYFDNPNQLIGDHPVMRGRIVKVNRTVGDDGRAHIVIDGLEETGYLMKNESASVAVSGHADLDGVARQLIDNLNSKIKAKHAHAGDASIQVASGSTLGGTVRDYTIVGGSVLSALTQLADLAEKPILIFDHSVAYGPAVGLQHAPIALDPTVNIVKLGTSQDEKSTTKKAGSGGEGATGAGTDEGAGTGSGDEREVADWHELTVLGHPGLRAGQTIAVTGLDTNPGKPVRISRVIHSYSTSTGYVCDVSLTDAGAGTIARPPVGAAAVVDKWNKAILTARQDHPNIDVGQATSYRAGSADGDEPTHRVGLNYRQVPAPKVVAPSTNSPVSTTDKLINKPIASPFAFDKVGLVTPVYPGMRAVLAHNRSISNDAIVVGWIWPSQPKSTPPPNKAGDHWLALPTELDTDGRPTGKGVHDLTDARGCRVVHARALHIVVGTAGLGDVGVRPSVPEDDTISIEHSSGTTIAISSDGAVKITTKNKAIVLDNGAVSLKLDGAAVAVS